MPEESSGPDRDVLRQKIEHVQESLRRLRAIGEEGEERFLADWKFEAAATRNLQVGIEAILDAANHIIARERLGLPKTYGDAIRILVREGILPRDKEEDLVRMVRFRNRAVHLYAEIDAQEVWAILDQNLGDFEVVTQALVRRYFRTES